MMGFLPGGRKAPPHTRVEGEHVYLRPGRRSDWRTWAELRLENREFLTPWEPAWPPDALSRRLFLRRLWRQGDDWRRDRGYAFLVFEVAANRLVGGIGLANVRRGVAQSATVGYWLGEDFTGRGYMTEALRAIIRFGFRQVGLHRIEACCLPANVASKSLLLRAGFTEEGYARAYLRINGRWCDHLQFAILREDLEDEGP